MSTEAKIYLNIEETRTKADNLHEEWKKTSLTWEDFLKGNEVYNAYSILDKFNDPGTCIQCHKPTGFNNMDDNDAFCQCRYDWPVPQSKPLMTGWICSRCGSSNGPFVSQCPCSRTSTVTY